MSRKRLSSYKNQNFEELKNECLKSKTLFIDKVFKFDVTDADWLRPGEICKDPRFLVKEASRFDVNQGQMADCWLVTAMAHLTRNQTIFQHVVPTDQSFQDNYAGIFRFRIWQCGEWIEVVVDDRLPTRDEKLIFVHSKNDNVFWSALLEKAYAKIYGSYDQLSSGGWFCEAMVDFTGGVVETVSLVPPPLNLEKILLKSIEKNSFMCVFMKPDPEIKDHQCSDGLVKGHAYSINKVQYVKPRDIPETLMLVRLRNPWGKVEWKGAWSDSSLEWKSISDEERKKIGLVSEDDGEFWMTISDLLTHFKYIEICHLSPTIFQDVVGAYAKIGWEENRFKGEWIKDVNAGGASRETIYTNPQFKITLSDSDDDEDNMCTLIIALMQKNKTRNVWHRIGFTSFNIDDQSMFPGVLSKEYILDKLSNATTTAFMHTREIVLRTKWSPGAYCILPSTYSPNHEGQFLLRVYSEKKNLMEEPDGIANVVQEFTQGLLNVNKPGKASLHPQDLNNPPEPSKTSLFQAVIRGNHLERLVYKSDQEVESFFYRIAGREQEIGWQGLQSLLQYALSPDLGLFTRSSDSRDVKFPKFECRNLIAMLDVNSSGKLDFDEFQTLWGKMRQWESSFLWCSKNTELITSLDLKQGLIKAGYRVPSSILGSLVKRHADDQGMFTFNDFVMCAVELQTS